MICTGTGVAPFASLLRDPETYEKYDEVILAHTCRTPQELAYGKTIVEALPNDPLIGELVGDKLRYYPTTTQEKSDTMGRVSDHIRDRRIFEALNIEPWPQPTDRVMICGSMGLNKDIMSLCADAGLNEGSNSSPADFVVEKAFVD